tara:strand:+ start:455 stop:892 length:438 start_codon:yes stop_codon:yes gene_type:complete
MKYLLPILLLIGSVAAFAANPTNSAFIVLAWDRSPDDRLTNGISYRVYAGTNLVSGAVNSITNINSGTNISVTFTNMQPATWYFSATALQGGVESLPSNIAIYSIPSVRPRPPGSLATVFLELTLDLTSYTDVGMFRARIFVPQP